MAVPAGAGALQPEHQHGDGPFVGQAPQPAEPAGTGEGPLQGASSCPNLAFTAVDLYTSAAACRPYK